MITSKLLWKDGYPDISDDEATCVAWTEGKIINTRCDTNGPYDFAYYSGTEDAGALSGTPSFSDNQFHRGYICEAKAIQTVSTNGKDGGDLCIFPFR